MASRWSSIPTTPEPSIDALEQRLWMADAILLPGGGDLSPRWYGQQPHPTLYGVDETQDAFDLALARWAIAGQDSAARHLPREPGGQCGARRHPGAGHDRGDRP